MTHLNFGEDTQLLIVRVLCSCSDHSRADFKVNTTGLPFTIINSIGWEFLNEHRCWLAKVEVEEVTKHKNNGRNAKRIFSVLFVIIPSGFSVKRPGSQMNESIPSSKDNYWH